MIKKHTLGPIRIIPGPDKARYPFCHSFFIEEAGVLIDPAADRNQLIELKNTGKVKMIWLSHWHEDHFRHLDLFDDLPFWIGEYDAPPLTDLELFMDWYGLDDPQFRESFGTQLKKDFNLRPRQPARLLHGGETIDLGIVTVEIIHAPGHTPGNLAFYFLEPKILFMGDVDLTPFGPWYGDLYSSIDDLIKTINRLRDIPAKIWLTSHETGLFEKEPGELWDNYLDVIRTRERKLLEVLKNPSNMEDIIHSWIIYGRPREPRDFYEFAERAHMQKHLEILLASGRITCKNGYYQKTDLDNGGI